jgi:tryptophan-rich sensory protein
MVLAAGLAGGLNGWIFSSGAVAWSSLLEEPRWAPPGSVIGGAWIALFQLKAIALWMVERLGRPGRRWLAALFILAQFGMSVLWVCAYFGLRDVTNGFVFTLLAWVLAVFTIWATGRASRGAGVLLWPMLGWLSFAIALSYTIMALNPTIPSGL